MTKKKYKLRKEVKEGLIDFALEILAIITFLLLAYMVVVLHILWFS